MRVCMVREAARRGSLQPQQLNLFFQTATPGLADHLCSAGADCAEHGGAVPRAGRGEGGRRAGVERAARGLGAPVNQPGCKRRCDVPSCGGREPDAGRPGGVGAGSGGGNGESGGGDAARAGTGAGASSPSRGRTWRRGTWCGVGREWKLG